MNVMRTWQRIWAALSGDDPAALRDQIRRLEDARRTDAEALSQPYTLL